MENMGSPGIKDLLYPGLESHGIFKSVGYGKPWKIKEFRQFCICKLRKQGKASAAHTQEAFPSKMAKFRLWNNAEGHDRGPGKVMEFSKLYR